MTVLNDFSGGRGQRAASFRFELLDKQNSILGDLTVSSTPTPTVSNNINRAVKRGLSGLRLPPSVTAEVNTLNERVRPWLVMEDGTEWPLGVFLFADVSRSLANQAGGFYNLTGEARWTEGSCLDQLATVNQGSRGVTAYPAGTTVYDALLEQLDVAGIVEYDLDQSDSVIAQPKVWKPNEKRLTIINDLCQLGGYFSLYFTNMGRGRLKRVRTLAATEVDTNYVDGMVYEETIVETDDLLDAPNVYVAVNSAFTDSPIWGEWAIPAEAPHSEQSRGFAVVKEIDVPGAESSNAAAEAAKAHGQADYSTYRWIDFTTPPDPKFDTFDVFGWLDGSVYRNQSWDMQLSEGGNMRHEGRRVWAEALADFVVEAE